MPPAESFKFDDGLASDYLSSDEVVHSFVVAGEDGQMPIMAADRAAHGVSVFSLRLVCHVVKATVKSGITLKYNMLIYPGARAAILDVSELAQSAGWPGIRIAEGDLALCPMPERAWQCPVLPLLLTNTTLSPDTEMPSGRELRRAIAAIMCRSTPPEVCKSKTEMMNKWQKYANNPDKFSARASPLTWPAPEEPEPVQGNNLTTSGILSIHRLFICNHIETQSKPWNFVAYLGLIMTSRQRELQRIKRKFYRIPVPKLILLFEMTVRAAEDGE